MVLRRGEHETINIRNLFALFCNQSTTQYGAIEWKSSQLLLAGDRAEIFRMYAKPPHGTVLTIRMRARINMLEHVLIGKVRTLCRDMLQLDLPEPLGALDLAFAL